jgi:molecular chaperone DnaK (HSP70)
MSDRNCRLFAIFRKARELPAVKVGNDGKEQQFVSTLKYGGLSYWNDLQSAEELSLMVLTNMRETAEQYLNKKVKWVTNIVASTVPIDWIHAATPSSLSPLILTTLNDAQSRMLAKLLV